jgi:hypothetical protein
MCRFGTRSAANRRSFPISRKDGGSSVLEARGFPGLFFCALYSASESGAATASRGWRSAAIPSQASIAAAPIMRAALAK